MGRAGSGGGGARSSVGHSAARSSSGHRPSASHTGGRATGSVNRSTGHTGGMSGMWMPRRTVVYHTGPRSGGSGGNALALILGLVVLAVVLVAIFSSAGGGIPASTYSRQRLQTGVAFHTDCVVDELGWVNNLPKTQRRLQNFYDQTGIQPYVVLRRYDASLADDAQKEAFARRWYEENIPDEGTLLFMYFAERNADTDVGFMALVSGKQIAAVMDAEAVDIFWAYTDTHWYSTMSTDDVLVKIFDDTAQRIMQKTTTSADVIRVVLILAVVAVLCGTGIWFWRQKLRRDREKEENTRKILETPLETLDADPTLHKYE